VGGTGTEEELMDEQALRSWLAADDPGELAIPPVMTTTVIDAARATQRRQRRTAVAGAAAAVLVVASAPVALSLDAGSTARRTPAAAAGSASVLDSLWGVDVTWLPAGLHPADTAAERFDAPTTAESSGNQTFVRQYQTSAAAAAASWAPLSVGVERQRPGRPVLAAPVLRGSQPTIVRGHPARTLPRRMAASAGGTVIWQESPDLVLTVSGNQPPAILRRVAAGLVVHPRPPGPVDEPAARAAVRSAVDRAFTGGQPDNTVFGALVDGDKLAGALSRLRARYPQQVAHARVDQPADVVFLSPSMAWVRVGVKVPPVAGSGVTSAEGPARLVGGGWKLDTQTYCSIRIGNGACP